MNLCKIKTVFFDLDGTLLDTAADLAFALNKLLEQEGISPISLEKIRQVASEGSKGLLALGLNINDDHPNYCRYREIFSHFYRQHLSVNTRLFPGMELVLKQLEEHDIQWGVVTNKRSFLAKQLLSDLDLANRCVCIIGSDCVIRTKPHPDALLLACEISHSLPKECVYIGDAERDIEAAKFAGMRSIAALYGYLRNDSAPEYWQADFYIDHPKDIMVWIEKQLACCYLTLASSGSMLG